MKTLLNAFLFLLAAASLAACEKKPSAANPAALVAPQPPAGSRQDAKSARPGQTQGEMNHAVCESLAKAEQEMKQTISQIVSQRAAEKVFVTKLSEAQAAWRLFRDAHFAARFPAADPMVAYGSVYPMCRCSELTALTTARAKELKVWLQTVEGDVCAGSAMPAPQVGANAIAGATTVPAGNAAPAPAAADPRGNVRGPAPLLDPAAGVAGGLRIGMSRAEAQRVMPLSAHPSGQMGDNVAVSGPYHLVFDAKDGLSSIEYNVTQSGAGVRIGAKTLPPTAGRAALAKALGGCAKPEPDEGGEQTICAGRRAMLKVVRACAKKDARGACTEWTNEKLDVLVQLRTP